MPLRPQRTIDELRELQLLTGDEHGAQRLAWTPTWQRAREWMRAKLAELPVTVELDEAGNQWATLPGQSERSLIIGGHIDSVPNGGWLDGALDLLAGLEVVRRLADQGTPPITVHLVDWADEEGVRFGRSLVGSSAVSGALDVDEARALRAADGTAAADVLADYGVDIERLPDSRRRLENVVAGVELHIEQGPVLEGLDLPLGVVVGTCGVERHRVRFTGQASHAGSTPMSRRRDPFAAAARLALSVRESAVAEDGVGTVGSVDVEPNIPTAVAASCEITIDQRHLDAEALARMLGWTRNACERIADEENVAFTWSPLWRIDPIAFDPALIELAEEAVHAVAGASHRLASGPLHDAAEPARAGVPTVMLFVQSLRGLSHTRDEDTRVEHLELAVRALDELVGRVLAREESVGGDG